MRIKPLLIILPVMVLLLAMFILDKPIEHKEAGGGTMTLNLVTGQLGDIKNDPGAPVFEACDTSSANIGELQYNCCVLASDEKCEEGWFAVELPDGLGHCRTGFVQEKNAVREELTISTKDGLRWSIVNDSLSHLGLKFVQYGTSLETGIDCSYFLNRIFADNGVMIPDTPNKIRDAGKQITMEEAEPGDIVFYVENEGYGHVGLYLGGGYQLNCSGHSGKVYPQGGVRITKVHYRDRETPYFYRILDDEVQQ